MAIRVAIGVATGMAIAPLMQRKGKERKGKDKKGKNINTY